MSKGTVLDLFIILVLLFSSAIGILVAARIYNSFNEAWTPSYAEGTQIMSRADTAVKTFNYGYLIFTLGLGLAAIIGAFMVPTHPIFFFLSLIMLGVVLLITPQFSNAYESFLGETEVSTIANDYPIMVNIMRHLPKILFGFGALVLVAMYGKINMGRGY